MPTLTIDYSSEAERFQYERMIAYIQEINRLDGTLTECPQPRQQRGLCVDRHGGAPLS